MSDGGAVADVETIRAALTCFWRGAEGTHSFCLPDDRREPALAALDALVSERERLQQRAETAESARSHLGEVNSVQRDRLREAEAERDRLAAAMVRLADDYRIADMQRNGADQAMRAERDRLAAALQRAKNLRPFKPKALADQYLVCINEGDWNLFAEALAALDAVEAERERLQQRVEELEGGTAEAVPSSGARLCYVEDSWAYFTTQPLGDQWGDDWNDAPYEHNAGTPYKYHDHDRKCGREPWEIVKVGWDAHDLQAPADLNPPNSNVSVEQINRREVAWLTDPGYGTRPRVMTPVVWAGVTVDEFRALIEAHGGRVYTATATAPRPSPPEDVALLRAEVERLTAQLAAEVEIADAFQAERDDLAAQLAEAQQAIREAYDYGCEWPIGTSDEPQEQRGGPRDTFIRNMAAALAVSPGEAPDSASPGSPGGGTVERTQGNAATDRCLAAANPDWPYVASALCTKHRDHDGPHSWSSAAAAGTQE